MTSDLTVLDVILNNIDHVIESELKLETEQQRLEGEIVSRRSTSV